MTTVRGSTHIIRINVPRHVSIRNELSVHVASDFTVPPAAVDVNYADHVPLRMRSEIKGFRKRVTGPINYQNGSLAFFCCTELKQVGLTEHLKAYKITFKCLLLGHYFLIKTFRPATILIKQ